MPWILVGIAAIIIIGLIIFASWAYDREFIIMTLISCILTAICIMLAIAFIINALCWTSVVINLEVSQADIKAKGIIYEDLLRNYDQILMVKDVTGSNSYLELYDKILNYNNEVRKAQKWKDIWWANGILYNPSYTEAELIPISVG